MADKKISQLTAASTPLAGTEVLPIVQSSATVNVSVDNLTTGKTVPMSKAQIKNNNAATPVISIVSYASSSDVADVVYDQSTDILKIRNPSNYAGSGVDICAGSGNLTRLHIDTSNNVSVTSGNLSFGTAAKGVNFTANTPAAGMTSQLLNWYEEGTWTPSLGGNATYFGQNGTYTRIGRLVFVQGLIYVNVIGSGSTTTISGLPFTPGNDSTATLTYFSGLATNVVSINGRIASGATSIVLYGLTAAGAIAQTPITTFQNQTYIQFSAVYSV